MTLEHESQAKDQASDWEHLASHIGNESAAGLQNLFLNAPTPVFIKDPEGRYLFVNAPYERAAGYSRKEILGRTDFDLFPHEIAAISRRNDLEAIEDNGAIERQVLVVADGEERTFTVLKFPIDREGKLVALCGISIEVTEGSVSSDEESPPGTHTHFERLLSSLTPQEVRVLHLLAAGLSDKEIAKKLSLADGTVRQHVSHLLKKLRMHSRTEAVVHLLRNRRS
jgi:PAS domain S-box-containing protein